MNWLRKKIKALYAWTTKWAQHKHAERYLAGITAAEGVFFPIPTDPLLMAMVFTKPNKWVRYGLITVFSSVIGGIIGYSIGFGLFESVGQWVLDAFHLQEEYVSLSQSFQENATLAVFTAALTPVPYKLITLTSGALLVNFGVFVVASILGRGARFMGVAFLARVLGKRYKEQIEKYIDIISLILVAIIIAIVVVR